LAKKRAHKEEEQKKKKAKQVEVNTKSLEDYNAKVSAADKQKNPIDSLKIFLSNPPFKSEEK